MKPSVNQVLLFILASTVALDNKAIQKGTGLNIDTVRKATKELGDNGKIDVKSEDGRSAKLFSAIKEGAKTAREAGVNDYTKYTFNGETIGKGKLVLALVRQFMADNKKATFSEINKAFPKTLHRKFGVVSRLKAAEDKSQKVKRFYIREDQILTSGDNVNFAVCSDWGVKNIQPMLAHAKELGYTVN